MIEKSEEEEDKEVFIEGYPYKEFKNIKFID